MSEDRMQEVKVIATGQVGGMRLQGDVVLNDRKVVLDLPFTGSERIAATLREVADYLDDHYTRRPMAFDQAAARKQGAAR